MILMVDAGNTRIKWAWHDGAAWRDQGVCSHLELDRLEEAWDDLPSPRRVLGCCVAGSEISDALELLVLRWRTTLEWVRPQPQYQTLRTRYAVDQLGADRWAALIGARTIESGSLVVVSAGTALTVDALTAAGEHLGGLIVPGTELMQQALASGTARLPEQRGAFQPFPVTTGDAIVSGAMQAQLGAVMRLAGELKLLGEELPVCVISGGNARLLQPYLNMRVRVVDNLVLEGLLRMASA